MATTLGILELELAPLAMGALRHLEKEAKEAEQAMGTFYVGRDAGRNEPCPCGSGKKYKKCCMRETVRLAQEHP